MDSLQRGRTPKYHFVKIRVIRGFKKNLPHQIMPVLIDFYNRIG